MSKDLKEELAWLDRALQAEAGKRGLVPKKNVFKRMWERVLKVLHATDQ